ncbi:MAG: glycosyltransferase, exosortase A system-associated [Pseudomonadota bacterium]|nr:glycosyltransferase, exosortase A system-associated [Pseudomonadota bacterium]MDP1903291.1 glycosyltransferase, exosortase A system-associated [Pseudomonadota bacterium]MDP2353385.1 glycosyltransferase, exosortase A system-associated [Pseudomonadota bacterium]
MTLRILHVFDHSLPLHSGYTFRSANILRGQRRLGWETFHLTSPKQGKIEREEETVDDLHFYRTAPPTGLWSQLPLFNQWALMRATEQRLLELARELKPDLLHAHSPVLNAYPALHVGQQLGIPVVYEIRAFWEDAAVDHGTQLEWGLRYRLTREMETRAVSQASQVVTICGGLRGDLVARGIPLEKIGVVPNAVDIEQFTRGGEADPALKARLGLTDSRVIGFLGSFYAYEGLDLLIEALPLILEKTPDVKVLLVGGGPQEASLMAQAAELGLTDKVVFVGRVPHAEVTRYYDLVDLLAYPRHAMRLTDLVTPLKPLEAMAQGRLLIASDVGGHQELIEDGYTGMLFRADDAANLAEKAVAALSLQDDGATLRANGRRFVENERNWGRSIANYSAIYGAALGRAP